MAVLPDDGEQQQVLHVITLEADVENALSQAMVETGHSAELHLSPQLTAQFLQQLERAVQYCFCEGYRKTAVLCIPRLRRHIRKLIERPFPHVPVLSYAEIAPGFQIEVLTTLSFANENVL